MRDEIGSISKPLLDWYDVNARDLPWRIAPKDSRAGVKADPYHVWLSEVMLQQTTVAAVAGYYQRFLSRWPRVQDLAAAADGDVMAAWAGLGYYARARNLLKCARVVVGDLGGQFPDTCQALMALPGIGPYTAAAIAAIAFGKPETVVDGNVERVMARLFAIETPLPVVKPQLVALAQSLTPENRAGDYAQAVMDLGATICTPRNPACGICPLMDKCDAREQGLQSRLPARLPKVAKPIRQGVIYIARRKDGAFLLERRPEKGLLGGMLGWPGTEWAKTVQDFPPFVADWAECPGEVRHTFTHFHLILKIRTAEISNQSGPHQGIFVPAQAFDRNDLPTVMRKAYDLVKQQGFAN